MNPIYRDLILKATDCKKNEVEPVFKDMVGKFGYLDGIPWEEFLYEAKAAYRRIQMETGDLAQKPSLKSYKTVGAEEVPGKTVEQLIHSWTSGPNGREPILWFCFTDGTRHGVVMPKDTE